jgi:hypothetical protein
MSIKICKNIPDHDECEDCIFHSANVSGVINIETAEYFFPTIREIAIFPLFEFMPEQTEKHCQQYKWREDSGKKE